MRQNGIIQKIHWTKSEEHCLEALLEAANAELFFSIRKRKGKYFWRRRRLMLVAYYQAHFRELPVRFRKRSMTLGRGLQHCTPELGARLFVKRNQIRR